MFSSDGNYLLQAKLVLLGTLVITGTLLSGCTEPGDRDKSVDSSRPSMSTSSDNSSLPDSSANTDGPTISRGENETVSSDPRGVYLDGVAKSLGITDPPLIELVRSVKPVDSPAAIVACLRNSGWPQASTADGGVDSGTIPTDQQSAYNLSLYTCSAQYPIDFKYTQPLTESQQIIIYDYYLDSLVPCLEQAGYDVPEPPSRAAWIGQAIAEGSGDSLWRPYTEIIETQSPSVLDVLTKKCPQYPPDDEIYGE